MLSVSQPKSFISTAARYRGARLAAGIADAALAAELMGLPEEEYQGYESGYFPTLELSHLMARTFGVSSAYIIGGNPVTHREKLASMIASGLAEFEASLPIVASTAFVSKRLTAALVAMRKHYADLETPAQAAAHIGWNALQYLAHEQGARPLSPDQLIVYALEYQLRPDLALLGAPPAPLWDDAGYPWWRPQSRDEHADSRAMVGPHFDWLRTGTSAAPALCLPLIEHIDGAWTLGKETFLLPRMMLPATATFVGDTLYGVINRIENEVSVLVVDPTRPGTKSVKLAGDGIIQIEYDTPAEDVVDPTHYRAASLEELYCVGSHVATARVTANFDED
jgi:hypothetical protein